MEWKLAFFATVSISLRFPSNIRSLTRADPSQGSLTYYIEAQISAYVGSGVRSLSVFIGNLGIIIDQELTPDKCNMLPSFRHQVDLAIVLDQELTCTVCSSVSTSCHDEGWSALLALTELT